MTKLKCERFSFVFDLCRIIRFFISIQHLIHLFGSLSEFFTIRIGIFPIRITDYRYKLVFLQKGNDEITPPPDVSPKSGKSFRYDEGSQTLANGRSSSGFRYFKPDEDSPLSRSPVVEKAGNAGDNRQKKGLISDLLSAVKDQSKIGDCLQDPSLPLSRPAAGYAPWNVSSSIVPRPHARDENPHEGLDDCSVARLGQWNPQNVTQRDSKRPKERPRDRVYKQRFSMGGSSVSRISV
jgi:hypothetical protein